MGRVHNPCASSATTQSYSRHCSVQSLEENISKMKSSLVLCSLLAAAAAKFCPGEKKGNKCRAGE